MRTDRIGQALAGALTLLALGCLPDAKLKLPYNDVPAARADWPTSPPADQGFDPSGLHAAYERFFSEDEFAPAFSLLVARHGVLVAEGYCRDLADIDRVTAMQSATKSVTSMLLGIAQAQGIVDDLDRPFVDYLSSAYATQGDMAQVTLRDLVTMRSGIDFLNGDFTMEMAYHSGSDSLAHIMAKPIVTPPGQVFRYKDADPTVVGDVLQKRLGAALTALADANLFGPLGITDYVWTAAPDGLTYGAYGLYLRPRDFLKLGQLMLDGGQWQGQQLIPAEWVAESTGPQVTPPDSAQPASMHFDYGYYWWLIPDRGVYSADGHGGQYLYVVPSKDLVIAFTAEPDTSDKERTGWLEYFVTLADVIVAAAN
jgi:CubicO group peptidase (beta-lactamase class C family)